jgi:hypothetical protein
LSQYAAIEVKFRRISGCQVVWSVGFVSIRIEWNMQVYNRVCVQDGNYESVSGKSREIFVAAASGFTLS